MSVFAPYTVFSKLPETVSNAGAKYSKDSAWWQFERLQYAVETDYCRHMSWWRREADQLEHAFWKQVEEAGIPGDQQIKENTERMLQAVQSAYERIAADEQASGDPQHQEMNETAKMRAEIL